jgi:hypothetical protein
MKTVKLTKRTQELISNGMSALGFNNPNDVYYYIEEELYCKEAKLIQEFLQWLFKINRPYGRVNAQQRWNEFISGEKAPEHYFLLKYEFDYDVKCTNGIFHNTSKQVERITNPNDINEVANIMKNFNFVNNEYRIKTVNENGELIKEYTHNEIKTTVDKLK